jgi:hypothetical protein
MEAWRCSWLALCVAVSVPSLAREAHSEERVRPYRVTEQHEVCEDYDSLRRPFFGDTHVHTTFSFDANIQNTRNTPRDAYRFAKGERIGIQPYDEEGGAQRSVQLARPLDYLAVTDHAELLGEVRLCSTPESDGYGSFMCWMNRTVPNFAFQAVAARTMVLKSRWGLCGDDGKACLDAAGEAWRDEQRAAEAAYDRSSACDFTSFVGYEWTASAGTGQNLHHNVIFRNERVPAAPVSWLDTENQFELWTGLERECVQGVPGCDALTIPHNSNLSGGLMFSSGRVMDDDERDHPIDAEEARLRARWEPLVEIMQHKGDSECALSNEDEFCAFEKLPYDTFGSKFSFFVSEESPEPRSHVRWSLGQGLRVDAEVGANPFRYGIIAATDTHLAAAGLTAERGHPGHGGAGLNAGQELPEGFLDDLEFNPGGLGVLWAEENTRDALFAAMQRREAYGTSGTRPVVRFFGGWDYPEDLCGSDDFAAVGYARGTPMGGDLPSRSEAAGAPRFAVWALRDPGTPDAPGTALQRIQIVKGWLEGGAVKERVVDVAGGANGASVDPLTCVSRGPGAESLCSVWRDPDFDPAERAYYYARVLENPTCRWSQFVCNDLGVRCDDESSIPDGFEGCCSEEHRPTVQERAWTSPIWYSPQS